MNGRSALGFSEGDWIDGTPYRVVRLLGAGGMGEVYEVDHTRAGTRRAIKVLRPTADPRGLIARRLRIEGRAMRALDHANIVRVFEVASLRDERPYFAMERLEGSNLRDRLRRGPAVSLERAVALMLQALAGLQAAHARSVIHRDVKPSNLFLTSTGELKVLDFGVAHWPDGRGSGTMTEPGVVMGTLRYMAPEQLRVGRADARTDVYAAGLVLFELLTGGRPFELIADESSSVMIRLRRPAPPLSDWADKPCPGGLEKTLAKALSTEPQDRHPSALAFAAALRRDMGWRERDGTRRDRRCFVPVARDVGRVCGESARSRMDNRTRPMLPGIRATRVVFIAHLVGVLVSAFAVVMAMAAVLTATRGRSGARIEATMRSAGARACPSARRMEFPSRVGVGAEGR